MKKLLALVLGTATAAALSAAPVQKDLTSLSPLIQGKSEALVKKADGFSPNGDYTLELRLKASKGKKNSVRIYSETGARSGFTLELGDSVMTFPDATALPYPQTVVERLNSGKWVNLRLAVTNDSLYIYHNAIPVGSHTLRLAPLPIECASGTAHSDNMLRNGDFESTADITYNVITEESGATCLRSMDGWFIYPYDNVWNSRAYIDPAGETGNALRIQQYDWSAGSHRVDALVQQAVNVVGGKPVKLTFSAYGGNFEEQFFGYAKLEEVGTGKSSKAVNIKNADSYQTYTLEYTPTEGCRQLKVVFGLRYPTDLLPWGEVPKVPMYVDNVTLEGETYAHAEPAFGYTTEGDAVVDYVKFDNTGAYAPVLAQITTDVSRLMLDASAGEATGEIAVTAQGLSSDNMITVMPSPYVTVRPPKLPYNAKGLKLKVTYNGTREHVLDTLYIKSGRTVCPVALELFGRNIPQGTPSDKATADNGRYSIAMPESGPFTLEVRAKAKAGAKDGIKIYAADLEGKGFGLYVADSALTADNPKSAQTNPLEIAGRKNSDMLHTFRIARTHDNMVHVYRDGNRAAILDGSEFIIPAEFATGSVPSEDNLLVNGDFNGSWDVSYVEDGGQKPYMSKLQGWDIYPIEPWNSRQTIAKWEISEADGYDTTNNALKVWRYGWNKGFSDALISQAVNVVPGQTYSLSFLAAGGIWESVKYGYVRIEEVADSKRAVTTAISSELPKEYKMSYTPTADCRQIRVVVGLKSPGAIGSWGAVPEVPIYVDKMVLTGQKAIGQGVIGVQAADGAEVEYVNYHIGEAYAPAKPAIALDVDKVIVKGTNSGAIVKITGTDLNPGEDIRIITPEGVVATPDHVAYNAKNSMSRIKLISTANRTYGNIIFRSGTTSLTVPFEGKGTPLEEKVLADSPVYTGSDASKTFTQADGFNPGKDGYTVEFRTKASRSASELAFTGTDAQASVHPFAGYEKAGVYNGTDKENRLSLAVDKDAHTYRYAVTPDRRVFVYRDGAPADTMLIDDYANPAGLEYTAAERKDNLLHNPGFEGASHTYVMNDDPDADVFCNYIQGWTILDGSNGWNSKTYIQKDVVSDDMGDDNHVMALSRYQWEDGWSDSKVSQIVDVVPGQTYNFSVMAKGGYRTSDDKALGFIRIEEVQTTTLGKEVTLDKSRYEFKRYTLSHKASAKCTQLRVILGLRKAGKGNQHEIMKYDDACLTGTSVEFTPQLTFTNKDSELEYFTFDAGGAYAPEMPHLNVDDDPLYFTRTLDEQTLQVSSSDVKGVDKLTLATTGDFLVEPEEVAANSDATTVTVTFLGTRDGSGSLVVSAGSFRTSVPLFGTASALETKDISANPFCTGEDATYLAGEADGFKPGKAGYTIELSAGLDRYSGGSFEIGSLNSREKGTNLVISDEFTGTSTEQGNVDFLQDQMIPNVGDFIYRITVTPDNLAYIFRDNVALDTLDLTSVPADLKFVSTTESTDCDNMVRNGNFSGNYEYTQYEEANMLSSLAGWHLSGLSEWNCRAFIVADSENPGSRILNFQRYEWNAGWADGEASQVVNVCPNTRYSFSAETRGGSGDGLNLASMQVSELGSVGTAQSINVSNSSSDFSTRTINFTTSADCRQVKLSFRLASSGKDHGPKCGFYVRNVKLSGKKPVSTPGIYLNSGAPYRFKYFTYDLSGAYLPTGYVGVDNIADATGEVSCLNIEGGIELRGLPEDATVEVFNTAGNCVRRLHGCRDNATIELPAGFYIVSVSADALKANFKTAVK